MHLIFEETTSSLYYSNDGRLRLETLRPYPQVAEDGSSLNLYVLQLDGVEVFASHDRVKADAYIAGYDCATEAIDAATRKEVELQRTADELHIDLPR